MFALYSVVAVMYEVSDNELKMSGHFDEVRSCRTTMCSRVLSRIPLIPVP